MDIFKLKIDKFNNVIVDNLPQDLELDFDYSLGNDSKNVDCYIRFIMNLSDLEDTLNIVPTLDLEKIHQLYFIYPKKSSKKYKTDVTRDTIKKPIKEDKKYIAPKMMSLSDDFTVFCFKYQK